MQYLFGSLMFITSTFLILLILVQRGRGGGLAGAFGGMGGQSAFGTKAGDLFTRITIIVAFFWILLSIAAIKILNMSQSSSVFGTGGAGAPATPGETPAGDATGPAGPSVTDVPPDGQPSLTGQPADTGTPAAPDAPAATGAPASDAAPASSPPAADSPATESPAPAASAPAGDGDK